MRAFVLTLVLIVALPLAVSCGGTGGTGSAEGQGSPPEPPDPSPTRNAENPAEQADQTTGVATGRPGDGQQPSANAAARCYVDSVNAEDLDALVDCFAPDGAVVDVSRRIEGRDPIRRWAGKEVMGGSLRVLEEDARPNGTRLLVHWAPAGSDGWQTFYTFEVRDGRIVVAGLQFA